MSPRVRKIRKVFNPPPIKGFKPYGSDTDGRKTEPVQLLFEEYEALRLCDYDFYNHHQASVIMGVSRPTFTRIYASVRQKVAMAFAEGRQIVIEGGKVYFDSDWYHCKDCKCYFDNPRKEIVEIVCPLCGSKQVVNYEVEDEMPDAGDDQHVDFCICVSCGYKKPHQPGKPCSNEVCPKCNAPLRRNVGGRRRGRLNN